MNGLPENVILIKLIYVGKDDSPYPNKKSRGEKDPSLITLVGRIRKYGTNCVFQSLDGSEKNLVVSKQSGKLYRDAVWFEYKDTSKETIHKLQKKAIEILKKSKKEKMKEAQLTVKLMKDTIGFLEDYLND